MRVCVRVSVSVSLGDLTVSRKTAVFRVPNIHVTFSSTDACRRRSAKISKATILAPSVGGRATQANAVLREKKQPLRPCNGINAL